MSIGADFTSNPPDSEVVGQGASRMREERAELVGVDAREHVLLDGGTAEPEYGRHRQGSAVVYVSETAPTTRPGGAALTADDVGRLWVKPDKNNAAAGYELYMYSLVSTSPNVYDWVCLFRFSSRVNQDLRTTASPVFAAIQAASAQFDSLSLTGGYAALAVATANGIRHAAVASPVPGDIWISP